jgi:Holliday junction resolvasome RuvABC DNA-binding subunit
LLLELKDKLPLMDAHTTRAAGGAPVAVASRPSSNTELLARALVNMGYKSAEADRAIEQLGAKAAELPLPDLLKESLAFLSK